MAEKYKANLQSVCANFVYMIGLNYNFNNIMLTLPTVAVCFVVGLAITAFFSISAVALAPCPAMITPSI